MFRECRALAAAHLVHVLAAGLAGAGGAVVETGAGDGDGEAGGADRRACLSVVEVHLNDQADRAGDVEALAVGAGVVRAGRGPAERW